MRWAKGIAGIIEAHYPIRCAGAPKTVQCIGLVRAPNLCPYTRKALLHATLPECPLRLVSAPVQRRAAFDDGWEDVQQAQERDRFRVLTVAEAAALRARDPSLSPWRVVAMQALVGVACAAAAWAFTQRASTAWSALYGAFATVVPSALMARGMTRGTRTAVAAAAGFLFWETLKIGVAVAMLVIAARAVPELNWPVLLVTMVVCIKVNWFALLWRGSRSKTSSTKEKA